MREKTRFFLPGIFSIAGIGLALLFIYLVTSGVPSYDIIDFYEGTLFTDSLIVLGLAIPILFIEYFILGIPFAGLYLFGNRMLKAAAYDLKIVKLGKSFGGIRIIRRAAAPALFSISSAGIITALIEDIILTVPSSVPEEYAFILPFSLILISSLIIMPIALALFIPTWILNDAGIVTQLKPGQREIRQCPDREGVGRWYANVLGGFSLVAFPLSMFYTHFYTPFVLNDVDFEFIPIAISSLWTIGLPILIIAFIIPIVILHERMRNRTDGLLQGYARRLGAADE